MVQPALVVRPLTPAIEVALAKGPKVGDEDDDDVYYYMDQADLAQKSD